MTEATPSSYWIASNALYINLNANGDPDYITGNTVSGAQILCYMKDIPGLGYDAGHNYRRWPLSCSPTYFTTDSEKYVYVAIPRPSNKINVAYVVFPSEKLDIYGKNADEEQVGDTQYYYIFLQGVISATNAGRTLPRQWERNIQTGTLSSDEAIDAGGENMWWRYSTVDDTVTFLKEIILGPSSIFQNLKARLFELAGHLLTGVADVDTPDSADDKILTPAVASFKYLSRLNADTAAGRITFENGLVSATLAEFLDQIRVQQMALLLGGAEFGTFMSGQTGGQVDEYGNAEFESIRSRSYIMTEEMIVNRLQGQEGDTLYSDVDQIEDVTTYVDETDGSTHYILTLVEKWEGYFTAQQYGNIVKGVVNTLAAKWAGVSDYTSPEELEHQEQDNGGNYFYTSWMQVYATHNTAPARLDVNQIDVVLYGDTEVPARLNFAPCKNMTIARWGCYLNPYDYPEGSAERNSIIRRQRLFEISVTDGRITKISGVNSPMLTAGNFGVTVGELPDFVKLYPSVREILQQVGEHTDWLYAQGAVIGNLVKVDKLGTPVPQSIYPTEDWVDGSLVENPVPGYGIYYANHWNDDTLQYETHYVTHRGVVWQCLQSQPVVIGGVATYYEPKWNSPYWRMVNGNENLSIEFVSSNGDKFYQGCVNTTVTPHLFYGNVDISEDIASQYWAWTRETESGKTPQDESWDAQPSHHTRVLHLTNAEMPTAWGRNNKAIFTCTVTVNDGKTTVIVQNQVIA